MVVWFTGMPKPVDLDSQDSHSEKQRVFCFQKGDDMETWTESTPLWVGIVEVLREFPRTIETVQFGLDTYYGWRVSAEIVSAELLRLASEGFVALTDSHVDALCGYKLTQYGLLLQEYETERCPYTECHADIVIDHKDGWRVCGKCRRTILIYTDDSDNPTSYLWTGGDALKILESKLPKMPKEPHACRPVPIRKGEFANG